MALLVLGWIKVAYPAAAPSAAEEAVGERTWSRDPDGTN
jgi:hypothetical protein